ncbi:MAG: PEP-CTERM sorting domain-containing protein [Terrimicrobiaceae bacterium]
MKLGGVWQRSRAALVLAGLFVIVGGTARAQVTLNIVNNFAEAVGGNYFGGHIENQDVSLYFTGIGASDVTYNGGTAVTAGSQVQLSSVTGGSFSLSSSINGGRVYAILGSSAPATIPLPSGPSPVSVTYPYSFIEFTTTSGGQADQSFVNQVSFPTSLSNGSQTNTWSPSSTAQGIATAFNTSFPSAPYAPAAGVAPGSGTPYAPYAATTVTRSAGSVQTPINGHRVIAASNVNLPAASPPTPVQLGTGYTNVPGFNNYLGWLQGNQPTEGWKFGYNSPGFPDSTYVGYLKVTGSADNYGIELSNFTYGGTFGVDGDITGGTTVTGMIMYASNNSTQSVFGATYTGNWTDMTIFGATDPTGSVVTTSGTLGSLSVASVLYTVSASLGPGILGSDAYTANNDNTNYFFTTGFTPGTALSGFFANSQFGGSAQSGFYDQNWYTMLQSGGAANGNYAGYFTPYDDHFSNLGVLMASDSGTLTWQLGVVPEPSAVALLTLGCTMLGGQFWRRSRRKSAA